MKKYNVGIIGYGWVASAHRGHQRHAAGAGHGGLFLARLDSAEVSAKHGGAIPVTPGRGDARADRFPRRLDLQLPASTREQAIAAAKAGKHLIIEKPLALSWKDCQAIQEAVQTRRASKRASASSAGSRASSSRSKRSSTKGCSGKFITARSIIITASARGMASSAGTPQRNAGGSSLLVRRLPRAGRAAALHGRRCRGGQRLLDAFDECKISRSTNIRRRSVTILKFKDGRVGKCASVIDCLQPYYFHVHLVGSEGSLLDNKIYSTHFGGLEQEPLERTLDEAARFRRRVRSSLSTAVRSVLHGARPGQEMPLTSLDNAMRTHEVIFAADSSADRHAHRRH